jgi:general secretion pathway protein L
MTRLLLVFLPAAGGALGWRRIADGAVAGRGEGIDSLPPSDEPEGIVAVIPAEAVALHAAALEGLSLPQARAAARLLVSENSIAPVDTLHVALGEVLADGEDRMIAAVDAALMTQWLASLQAVGLDPDVMIPAPLLLPRPSDGYVTGMIEGMAVVRGRSSGWSDDPALTPLLTGEAPVTVLSPEDTERAIAIEVAAPSLNLRQGRFAKRQRWRIDWPLVRRLGWLGVAIATVTLLISIAAIARYSLAADALDLQADNAARSGLPRGDAANPVQALEDRLAGLRGGGLGFSATTGALFSAVQSTAGVELATLDFAADGSVRATVLAPGAPEVEALLARIRQAGLPVTASPFQTEGGRIRGELRISAP